MDLLLHEIVHLVISLLAGALVWKKYKLALPAFTAALLGGFLIDADHLFDYFLVFGLNFELVKFFSNVQFGISNKVYVPFHGWEYVLLLSLLYLNLEVKFKKKKLYLAKFLLSFILALNLGMYSHLIIDTLTNSVVLPGYSIIYRAVNNFAADKITDEKLPFD